MAAAVAAGAPVHTGAPRNATEAFVRAQWDPATYDGAAVGLQLVGRRLNEERLLGVLRRVEDALHRGPGADTGTKADAGAGA